MTEALQKIKDPEKKLILLLNLRERIYYDQALELYTVAGHLTKEEWEAFLAAIYLFKQSIDLVKRVEEETK